MHLFVIESNMLSMSTCLGYFFKIMSLGSKSGSMDLLSLYLYDGILVVCSCLASC